MVKSAISVIVFSAMILLLMAGMVWETDYQELREQRGYKQWLHERALAEWRADPVAQAARKIQ